MAEAYAKPRSVRMAHQPRRRNGPGRQTGQEGRALEATRVRIARTATDRVATVNASLSQISTSVCAALATAAWFLATHTASRCSGVPVLVTVSTSLASAA